MGIRPHLWYMRMGPFITTCRMYDTRMGLLWYGNGTSPHLFGVEVVAVLSVGVPVLDADGGPPLATADLRDAVIPQP